MAACIARAQGFTKSGDARNNETTRLGSGSVTVQAATWRTFVDVTVFADGSGLVTVRRQHAGDKTLLHQFAFDSENVDSAGKTVT